MDNVQSLFKAYHLQELYLRLTPEEKKALPFCVPFDEGFAIRTPVRMLWVTAANAIPRGYYSLAEKLLIAALNKKPQGDDYAWVHANLAQLYYDEISKIPEAREKCLHHLNELMESGYFLAWALGLKNELTKLIL